MLKHHLHPCFCLIVALRNLFSKHDEILQKRRRLTSSLQHFCVRLSCRTAAEEQEVTGTSAQTALQLLSSTGHRRPTPPANKTLCPADSYTYKEVRSFIENKLPNKSRTKEFLQYNRKALSRIYPKSQRVESSNYDPYPMWAVGCHMVALNFQTGGLGFSQTLGLRNKQKSK